MKKKNKWPFPKSESYNNFFDKLNKFIKAKGLKPLRIDWNPNKFILTPGYLHPGPAAKGLWAFSLFKTIDKYHAMLYCPNCCDNTVHKLHTSWWVCCALCGSHRRWRFGEEVRIYWNTSVVDFLRPIQLLENKSLSKEVDELSKNNLDN